MHAKTFFLVALLALVGVGPVAHAATAGCAGVAPLRTSCQVGLEPSPSTAVPVVTCSGAARDGGLLTGQIRVQLATPRGASGVAFLQHTCRFAAGVAISSSTSAPPTWPAGAGAIVTVGVAPFAVAPPAGPWAVHVEQP